MPNYIWHPELVPPLPAKEYVNAVKGESLQDYSLPVTKTLMFSSSNLFPFIGREIAW